MNASTFFLALLLVFSGVAMGILLVRIAPEEQSPLRKKIRLFTVLLAGPIVLLPALSAIYFSQFWRALLLIILLIFIARKGMLGRTALVFSALGIPFALASTNPGIFFIESMLLIMYGLGSGILSVKRNLKNSGSVLLSHLGFAGAAAFTYMLLGFFQVQ